MFKNRRTKTTIIVLAIVVTISVVLSTIPAIFTTVSTEHKQSSNSVQTSQVEDRVPPASPLTVAGRQDTFEHAKLVAGLLWPSLPTYMPADLQLASVRIRDGGPITAIYAPAGVTALDNDTDQKILDAGGVFIEYLLQVGGPTANLTANMEIQTKEFPNMHLETINNHQALVGPGGVDINAGNCMDKTNCSLLIHIGSEKLNSTDYMLIAKSINIPPMGSSGISAITLNSLHNSSTSVFTNQTAGHIGMPIFFKALINDTNTGTKTAPVGEIVWDDGGAGGIFGPSGGAHYSICDEVNATSDSYECTASYIPSKTGQITITATYYGDTVHHTSSGSLTLKVS